MFHKHQTKWIKGTVLHQFVVPRLIYIYINCISRKKIIFCVHSITLIFIYVLQLYSYHMIFSVFIVGSQSGQYQLHSPTFFTCTYYGILVRSIPITLPRSFLFHFIFMGSQSGQYQLHSPIYFYFISFLWDPSQVDTHYTPPSIFISFILWDPSQVDANYTPPSIFILFFYSCIHMNTSFT